MDREARLRLGVNRSLAALVLSGVATCAAAAPSDLRVHVDPAAGVLRIENPSRRMARLYYNSAESFPGFQMFHIRFRDRTGRILTGRGPDGQGWWTPLAMTSTIYRIGHVPRTELRVPAGGRLDFPRAAAMASLSTGLDHAAVQGAGPCAVQFMLIVFPDRRSNSPIRATSEWTPAPCRGR
jgi:hypothetical protein